MSAMRRDLGQLALALDVDVGGPIAPPFSWYGAKSSAAAQIASVLPPHAIYADLFAGSGAVFYAKPPALERSILNDLNDISPAAHRGIRDDWGAVWRQLPPALDEHVWRASAAVVCSPIPPHCDTCAAASVIVAFAGAFNHSPYSGSMSSRAPAKWRRLYDGALRSRLQQAAVKLNGVHLCDFDALRLLDDWGGPGVLFFCDPPYMRREHGGGSRGAHYAGYGFADPPAEWHGGFIDALGRAVARGADAVVTTGVDELYVEALPALGLRQVGAFGREGRGRGSAGGSSRAKHLLWATRTAA